MQGGDPPSAWGPKLGSNAACGEDLGEVEERGELGGGGLRGAGQGALGWKHAAASGLSDAFNHYSQVKYQVVVALFGDAVMEPHCGRDRKVMGYAWLPPRYPGRPLRPPGCKQEPGKGRAGLFRLPPPLAVAAWLGGGAPRSMGDPSRGPSLWQRCKAQRSHPNRGWPGDGGLAKGPGSCWAILGTGLQARVPPAQPSAPSGEVPGCRESSARAPGCQPWHRRGFFYFLLMTFFFSLGGLGLGISRNHHRMSFLRRKCGTSPRSSRQGHPLPSGTARQARPGANLPPCSRGPLIQA